MDDESKGALSGELSADNATGKVTAKGHIGNAFLRAMGRGAAWLAPGHDAKVKLSQAMVQRLTAKIASGEVLNEQETQFVNMVFEREAIKQMNRLDVSARTNSALLEVDELLRGLPEPETSTTTDTFMRRAEAIAGEIHEEELRELFARVLAGEICKPGAFSIKTLETIRSLDPEVAAAFNRARARVFDCEWILENELAEMNHKTVGLSPRDQIELRDAGLLTGDFWLRLCGVKSPTEFRCGDPKRMEWLLVESDHRIIRSA